MKVYRRPSCLGRFLLLLFFIAAFAVLLFGLFQVNDYLVTK